MKKGFTLVELAIVLVIIGLLIGGILAAQTMSQTAKITKAVSQIQQYDVAVQQFKSTYGGLPGDSDKLTYPGNNNGFIDDFWTKSGIDDKTRLFLGEMRNFWPSLQIAGFKIEGLNSNLPLLSISSPAGGPLYVKGANQNSPKFVLGDNTAVIAFTKTTQTNIGATVAYQTSQVTQVVPPGNYYELLDVTNMSSTGTVYDGHQAVPVVEAMAFDQKLDDGSPVTGTVLNSTWMWQTTPSNCMTNSSATKYLITAANGKCSLIIRMTD